MRLRRSMRLASAITFAGAIAVESPANPPTTKPVIRTVEHLVRVVVSVPVGTTTDAIYLAGNAAGVGRWRPDGLRLERQADGRYAGDVALPPGTRLEFKLTRRGTWASVERHADGRDRDNRLLSVEPDVRQVDLSVERWADGGVDAVAAAAQPATQPAAVPRDAVPHTVVGTLRLHDLPAPSLAGRRSVRVWLPPGYDANADARYDVLYLHDGQNCFDRATSAFGQEWCVDETLTAMIADRKIRPLIVVAIDNGGLHRIDELTFERDPKVGGGRGAAYATFLLDQVIPFVDATYRTNTGGDHRYLGGASLGGVASLEIARRHPGAFAGVIAMSPSLWWNDQSLTHAIDKDAGPLRRARVWLDIGTAEAGTNLVENDRAVEQTRELDGVLSRHGVPHHLEIAPDAAHNEAAWAERFPRAIAFLLGR